MLHRIVVFFKWLFTYNKVKREKFYNEYLYELADKYGLQLKDYYSRQCIFIGDYPLIGYDSIDITMFYILWNGVYDEVWCPDIMNFKEVKPDIRCNKIEMGKITDKKKIESSLQEAIKIYKESKMKLKALKMMKDFN